MIRCNICNDVLDLKKESHYELKLLNTKYTDNPKNKLFCLSKNYDSRYIHVCKRCIDEVISKIYNALNIGKWIWSCGSSSGSYAEIYCSKCGGKYLSSGKNDIPDKCPNCKSIMDTYYLYNDNGTKINKED